MELPASDEPTHISKAPKKRRLRACDSCRQRKIRCDNLPGSCRNCQTYGDECIITRDGKSHARSIMPSSVRPYINKSSASRTFSKSDHDRLATLSRESQSSEPSPPFNTSNVTTFPQPETTDTVQSFGDLMNKDEDHRAETFASGGATTETPAALPIFNSPSVSIDTVHGVITTEVGRFPRNSKFAGLSSPQVFAKSAEEHFKGIAPHINVMDFFCPTMSFAEELPNQPTEHRPLVVKEIADVCIQRFLSTYNQLFPILNSRAFCEAYLQFYDAGKCSDSAVVACFYFAIALGSEDEEIGDLHSQAACKLQGELLARPYMSSVQALILMTLCLINTGRDSQALLTVGTAARIAQSIGLHRSLSAHNHPHEFEFVMKEHHLRSCIWWVCYCLDKKLSFELGRPSTICDDDCDADLPDISQAFTPSTDPAPETETTNFLSSLINLCSRLSIIASTLFHINTLKLDEEIIISRVVEADRHLQEWRSSLPPEISLDRDLNKSETELQSVASSLLNCMYLNALVVVHRFSLISRNRSTYLITHSKRHVVASEKICSSAAHSLAHVTSNLITEQREIQVPRWIHPYAINTVIALFILIMRSPRKWSRDVDIALLWSMRHCFQSREDATYAERFDRLVDSLIRALEIPLSGQQQDASTHIGEKGNPNSIGIRSRALDINEGRDGHIARSPISQPLGPFHSNDDNTAVAHSPTQEEADGYEGMLGDYAYLGNFQLWPVAPLYEIDQFDPNRGVF